MTKLYDWITKSATWPTFTLLLMTMYGLGAGFELRHSKLSELAPPDYHIELLDERIRGYTPREVRKLFHNLGPEGLRLYLVTQLTLDLLFPFIYGATCAVLIVHLFEVQHGRWILLLPICAVAADLLENFASVYLIATYARADSNFSWVCMTFTALKWTLVVLTAFVILVGALKGAARDKTPPPDDRDSYSEYLGY